MRLIVLLLAVLVAGPLVARQLSSSPPAQVARPDANAAADAPAVPVVPTRPQDLPGFEKQMEGYVSDLAADRAKQLEQAEAGK